MLSFYDWCISILSSKKCQTKIILADFLGNESLLQRVQKVIFGDLWLVDFDPFLCFKVRCLWSYCDQNPTLIFQIFLIDFIPGLQTSKFRWGKNTEKCDKVPCASRAFFSTCLLPCTRRLNGRHSPRFGCLLALFTLARIACLLHICVKTSRFHYSIWATPK